MTDANATTTRADSNLAAAVTRRAIQVVLVTALWFVCFFAAAGTLHWPRAWLYGGLSLLLLVANFIYVLPRNPAVIAERGRGHSGTKRFDKVFGLIFAPLMLGAPVVAGLDAVRFAWSSLPMEACWPGLAMVILGNIPIAWAMATNPHLEPTVRIQEERGHRVITTGPYAIVRHPMYTGMLLQQLGLPLVLGSLWGLLPAFLILALMVLRTALEDRTLRVELPGYEAFTGQTRYRLLPGVW